MLVKVTDVSCRDSFHCDKSDLVGCVFEVHETDLIAWKGGWFGIDKCRLVSGSTSKSEWLFGGFDNSFHEVKFEEVILS